MIQLSFLKTEIVYSLCQEIIDKLNKSTQKIDTDIHKNIIDPFSAIFDASFQKISITQWFEQEKKRQLTESFQNTIGNFHQSVLSNIDGYRNLGTGKIVDIVSDKHKIIAEIKNKFNTTKGNHKPQIYDDLESVINSEYQGYTGYYVAILTKKRFNKPFTPSDNKTKTNRTVNEQIREIDGASFYELVTGQKDAIRQLYLAIPIVLGDILNHDSSKIIKDPLFDELFIKAFN